MASDDTLARLVFLGTLGILSAGIIGATVGPGVSTDNPAPHVQTPELESGDTTAVPRANGSSNLTSEQVAKIERNVVAYANAERVDINHTPLIRNPDLAMVARAHSHDMAKRDFYDHVNPDGQDQFDRAKESGITCDLVSENIVIVPWGRTLGPYGNEWVRYEKPRRFARDIVARFMESGGHRWSILTPKHDVIGVGAYAKANDQVAVTMMFCGHDEWEGRGTGGRDALVAEPGADYNTSTWRPYPSHMNASWADRNFTG